MTLSSVSLSISSLSNNSKASTQKLKLQGGGSDLWLLWKQANDKRISLQGSSQYPKRDNTRATVRKRMETLSSDTPRAKLK